MTLGYPAPNILMNGGEGAFLEYFGPSGDPIGNLKRRAEYSSNWIRSSSKVWVPLGYAKYTAASLGGNPQNGSDAGLTNGAYYLQAGGDTTSNLASGTYLSLPLATPAPTFSVGKTVSVRATYNPTAQQIAVSWISDSTVSPQFAYKMEVFDNPALEGSSLYSQSDIAPHVRSVSGSLSLATGQDFYVRVTTTDIFDQQAEPLITKLSIPTGLAITGVANAASNIEGGIAPGEYLAIYGYNLGPGNGLVSGSASGEEKGLGGVRVMFDAVEAYLAYASATQLNVLVPYGVSGKALSTLQVDYNGTSGSLALPVLGAAPGIFTEQYGPGPAWVVNAQDGTFNSTTNAASQGSYIELWATGQGQVSPAGADGSVITTGHWPSPTLPVMVLIGGRVVTPSWVGLVFTGVIQLNVRIPDDAPTGNAVPLQLYIGGAGTRADATLSIKAR